MAILITSTHKFNYGGTKSNIYGRLKSMVFDNNIDNERLIINFEYFFNEAARSSKSIPIEPDSRDSLFHVKQVFLHKNELANLVPFDATLTDMLQQLGTRVYELWEDKISTYNDELKEGHWTYDKDTPDEFTPPEIIFSASP